MVLNANVAFRQHREPGHVLELALSNQFSKLRAVQLILDNLHSVQPMLSMVSVGNQPKVIELPTGRFLPWSYQAKAILRMSSDFPIPVFVVV
jgi:hypothetical protein